MTDGRGDDSTFDPPDDDRSVEGTDVVSEDGRGDGDAPDERGDDAAHEHGHTEEDRPREGDEWRFGVDDVDENGVVEPSIEPETIDVENAVFVVIGVLIALLLFARAATVFAI